MGGVNVRIQLWNNTLDVSSTINRQLDGLFTVCRNGLQQFCTQQYCFHPFLSYIRSRAYAQVTHQEPSDLLTEILDQPAVEYLAGCT